MSRKKGLLRFSWIRGEKVAWMNPDPNLPALYFASVFGSGTESVEAILTGTVNYVN